MLNDSDPFSTAFTVTNSGELFTLREVKAGCGGQITYVATRPQKFSPIALLGYTSRARLHPGEAFTVPCIGGLKDNPDGALAIGEAHITMRAAYALRFLPIRLTDEVPYRLTQGANRKFYWLPD